MKTLFALLASLFLFAAPTWAVDVSMGSGMDLAFSPTEININAGDTIRFVNEALPPHNVIVEDHPDLSHDGLAFAPGESFEITFPDPGDYTFYCDPHKGAGMIGHIHVS
jgi:plastocyanin